MNVGMDHAPVNGRASCGTYSANRVDEPWADHDRSLLLAPDAETHPGQCQPAMHAVRLVHGGHSDASGN